MSGTMLGKLKKRNTAKASVMTFRERIRRRKDERGVALLTVVAASLVLFAVVATILTSTSMTVLSSSLELSQDQARERAETAADIGAELFASKQGGYTEDDFTFAPSCAGISERCIEVPAGHEYDWDDSVFYCRAEAVELNDGDLERGRKASFYQIFASDSDTPPAHYTEASPRCPTTGDKWFLVRGVGYGKNGAATEVSRTYQYFDQEGYAPANTVAVAGNMRLHSSVDIFSNPGSKILPNVVETGDGGTGLRCDNNSTVEANLFSETEIVYGNGNCRGLGNAVSGVEVNLSANTERTVGYACAPIRTIHSNINAAPTPQHLGDCGDFKNEYPGYAPQPDPDNYWVLGTDSCNVHLASKTAFASFLEGRNAGNKGVLHFGNCTAAQLGVLDTTTEVTAEIGTEISLIFNKEVNWKNMTFTKKQGVNSAAVNIISTATTGTSNIVIRLGDVRYKDGVMGAVVSSAQNRRIELNAGTELNGWTAAGRGTNSSTSDSSYVRFYPNSSITYFPVTVPPNAFAPDIGKERQYQPLVRVL